MNKQIENLPNGILLITHQLQHIHSVTLSVSFRTGTLYETEKNNGISHMVEHLFFRKLSNLTQRKLYLEMQKIGAEIIGRTYCDYVCFSITVVKKYFQKAFDILLKFLDDFEWSASEINAEKEVVLRQIDNYRLSYDKWIDSIYFQSTNYALPIMGTYASVCDSSETDINQWKHNYITTQNACFVITGNFSDNDYLYAQKCLSSVTKSGIQHKLITNLPLNFGKREFENQIYYECTDNDISDITIIFDINKDIKYENIRLLSSILGEGCGSLLSIKMREKESITDDIFTNLTSYYKFNRLSFSYSVKNQMIDKSVELLFETLNKITHEINKNDYLSSIVFFTDDQLMNYDDTKKLNEEYTLCDFVLDIQPSEPKEKAYAYKNIKIKDLINTAKQVFVKDNFSAIIETDLEKNEIYNVINRNLKYL